MASCKDCGADVIWVNTPGKAGAMWWTRYDGADGQVQFQRSADLQYITGAILKRHRCGKPAEKPVDASLPPTPPPPLRDYERDAGRAAASAAQIDAGPTEPEGFFDDNLPF